MPQAPARQRRLHPLLQTTRGRHLPLADHRVSRRLGPGNLPGRGRAGGRPLPGDEQERGAPNHPQEPGVPLVPELAPAHPPRHQTRQPHAGPRVQLQGHRLRQHAHGRQGRETLFLPRHASVDRARGHPRRLGVGGRLLEYWCGGLGVPVEPDPVPEPQRQVSQGHLPAHHRVRCAQTLADSADGS